MIKSPNPKVSGLHRLRFQLCKFFGEFSRAFLEFLFAFWQEKIFGVTRTAVES